MKRKKIDISEYEFTIETKERKEKGIYYTDKTLATAMINDIKISKDDSIYDPYCGVGVFLSILQLLGYKNLYGSDIDRHAIELASSNYNNINFKVYDGIQKDLVKAFEINKYDVVIGNPPYVQKTILNNGYDDNLNKLFSEYGNNLYIIALFKSINLLKNNGILSYIIPKNFLHVSSYKKLRELILKDYTIQSIVDLGSIFKNVKGEQIVITIKKSKPLKTDSIYFKKYINGAFIKLSCCQQHSFDDKIIFFNSEEEKELYFKLTHDYKKLNSYITGTIKRGKSKFINALRGKDIQKFSYKDGRQIANTNRILIQNIYSAEAGIIATLASSNEIEVNETVTIIEDGNSKTCRYILGIMHSNLCNYYLSHFIYNSLKVTMHTDSKYITQIPIPDEEDFLSKRIIKIVKKLEILEYRSNEWFKCFYELNKLVYKIYKISDQEKNYIELYLKSSQSSRWWINEKHE